MLESALNEILDEARGFLHLGKVTDCVPELAKANPDHLGVCVITTKGECFHAGDWELRFTMQSIAKTITLILALKAAGEQEVFSGAGMEPVGETFNSFAKLDKSPIPSNPMINAGAISTAACCVKYIKDPYKEFLDLARKLCGCNDIALDFDVYLSTKETGKRNRALAYIMEDSKILKCDAESAVDFYDKTCSAIVNTKALAFYAMLLANNGRNPVTGEEVVEGKIISTVKAIMLTCGMYNASGEFAVRVGMPAKSGVGGGIIACAENRMGIATFGPAVDGAGNSVGGYIIMEKLSHTLGLHLFSGDLHRVKV